MGSMEKTSYIYPLVMQNHSELNDELYNYHLQTIYLISQHNYVLNNNKIVSNAIQIEIIYIF